MEARERERARRIRTARGRGYGYTFARSTRRVRHVASSSFLPRQREARSRRRHEGGVVQLVHCTVPDAVRRVSYASWCGERDWVAQRGGVPVDGTAPWSPAVEKCLFCDLAPSHVKWWVLCVPGFYLSFPSFPLSSLFRRRRKFAERWVPLSRVCLCKYKRRLCK